MQETWDQSLGWENSLEEDMAAHSSILVWRIPMDRGARWAIVHGVAKSRTRLRDEAQHMHTHTHTHIYTHIRIHVYACVHVCSVMSDSF